MTPKEKAKQLIKKFTEPTKVPNVKGIWVNDIDGAKQCAKISVEEIIKETMLHDKTISDHHRSGFWKEVMSELESI